MHMAECVAVVPDGVADAAFVDLHVVCIIENFKLGRTDQADHLSCVLSIFEEVADVVGCNVQAFQVHLNSGLLCQCRALLKVAEHSAGLDCIGKVVIVVDDDAAVTQSVGMNGYTGSVQEFGSLAGLLQIFHISFCLVGIDQGKICVTVETADRDSRLLSSFLDCVQILLGPAPELNCVKTVILSSLESVQERNLTIKRINTCRSLHNT